MKIRHVVKSWLLPLLVAALLVWAGGFAAAQQVTLVHLTRPLPNTDHHMAAKAAFEALNPDIRIEFIHSASNNDWLEKITTMWAGGTFPDVLETMPDRNFEHSINGFFLDLNPYMARESNLDWSDFVPLGVEAARVPEGRPNAGIQWALPQALFVLGAGVNLDMVAEAGLQSPTEFDHQWTWDEFHEMSQRVVRYDADGNVSRYAARMPNHANRWPVWVHNAGGWHFDAYVDPSESRLLTEPVKTAMQFIHDAIHVYQYAHPDNARAGWFAGGGLTPFTVDVTTGYAALYEAAGYTFNYELLAMPKNVRGGSEVSVQALSIGATTKHADAAWRWIKFLAATETGMKEYMSLWGYPPAWRGAIPLYYELVTPAEHIWVELMSRPDAYVRPIQDGRLTSVLQQYIGEIHVRGERPVELVLEEADQVISALLKELKGQ